VRTRSRPLTAAPARRWRIANVRFLAAMLASPRPVKAGPPAFGRGSRYVALLKTRKTRLASLSQDVRQAIAMLHVLQKHRAQLVRGSVEHAATADMFRSVSADLVELTTEQASVGAAIGLSTDTIVAIESRAT
jgi:hypothetical protein